MNPVEVMITVGGGISVKLSQGVSGKRVLIIKRPSGDQREPDDRLYLNLEQWEEIVTAVGTLAGMVATGEQENA